MYISTPFVGIWAESPLSLAWIGLVWLSKPALLTEHVLPQSLRRAKLR